MQTFLNLQHVNIYGDRFLRDQTIAVSGDEKQSLETVAEEKFGTSDVPYGAIITSLTSEYLEEGTDE